MIVIIDFGVGNLGSILNMLKRIRATAVISSDVSVIKKADKLILPGVGSFDYGMRKLAEHGFVHVLNEMVLEHGISVLGICLGMQLFSRKSEEGGLPGLGWLDADTQRFKFDENNANLKVPHMGWNTVSIKDKSSIFKNMHDDARFYFVHSLHLVCDNESNILATSHHGYDFVSAVQKDNIIGTQFHPEKSHKFGMRLLENFAGVD
jgi:glutamine amidotransferase